MVNETENTTPRKARKARKKAVRRKRPDASASTAKGTPWTFPKNTLEDAIRIPKAIEDKNAGNAMPAPELALAVGFKLSGDWRFLDLLRSANQYNLVSGTGAAASISLT